MQTIKHMLAADINANGYKDIHSPYDRQVIARIETIGEEGVEAALAVAYKLFKNRQQWLPAEQRITILETAATLMSQRIEELTRLAAAEGGKPWQDSEAEVIRAIDSIRWCATCIRNQNAATVPMGLNAASAGKLAVTLHEPIGVVVAISAFNHPLNLIAHQVGPAIAAGCPVIVKPAGDTPMSCFRFVEILREAGLPDGWCQALVTDSTDTASALVTDQRTGFLSFIGSAAVGWKLRSQLAPGARCALEHGGVAPVIVDKSADIDKLLPKILKGGFYHAGQVCVSVQRIFAPAGSARQLASSLAQQAQKLVVGDPLNKETEVGPLIRPAEVTRIQQWVTEAVAEGAELLCGGQPLSETLYPCTVLYNPAADSKVSRDEIFGPVICIYPYDTLQQAITQANDLDVAFQAAVFAENIETALAVSRTLDASAVMINDHTAFRVDWMPFAGLKHSGLGTGGIPYTYQEMQITKMVLLDAAHLN